MEPSLTTSIGKIQLDRPAMLASGILGISLDVFNRLYRSGAGAVVSKSLSNEPWEGYPNPTIFSVNGGGWINAVGLSNPGAPTFATWGQDKFNSNAVTLQFVNSSIIILKSSGTEPTKLTIIGTS